MRSVFIEDLKHGQTVSDIWAVSTCEERHDKNGQPYLCFELIDRTGTLSGYYYSPRHGEYEAARDMEFAHIRGTKNDFGLRLSAFPQAVSRPDDLGLFLPVSPVPLPELTRRFDAVAAQITEPQLCRLLHGLFAPGTQARERFWDAPAAVRNHHAYKHGLLEHSVEVAEFCLLLWNRSPGHATHPFQRDLLLTGALLHDIGKVREISGGERGGYHFSTPGRLLGHTALGLMSVRIALDKLIAPPLRDLLLHLIASHHGKCEFGAPTPPMTREALVLHKADALSAELFYADAALDKARKNPPIDEYVKVRNLPGEALFVGDYGFASPTDAPPDLWKIVCPWRGGDFFGANTENQFATVHLPLLARAAAGPGVYSEADIEGHFAVAAWTKEISDASHYLLRVRGDSMTRAGIADTDLLIVQASRQAQHGDIVVVTLPDGAVTVKRLERLAGSSDSGRAALYAESVETAYPSPFVSHGTDFRIEGIAVGVLRPA